MSGLPVVIGSTEPWSGGGVGTVATCVLAPNPSAMTLDGTNTWLLAAPGSSRAVLVDPGPEDPVHLEQVLQVVQDRDISVTRILLTHGHLDHSEGARLFAESLSAPVLALDPAHRLGSEGLTPGEVVQVEDLEVEVVASPGHSSDSLSFLVRDHAVLLTGDTILGRGTTVVAHPDGSLADYLASLDRLQDVVSAFDIQDLLPGHGPAVSEPAGLIQDYLTHRQARLDQVRDAIREGARTPMDVVNTVYQPIPDEVIPAALASVRAQWDYLQSSRD